ncbi:hypothetical protein LZ554_006410 [Drepanopeziza brunnea f. sp. 'monogermtubi']|nr:hypothetical protein LZ554_006410 [Drepanopeziza brunnea f. sp. 'monogermtubi']
MALPRLQHPPNRRLLEPKHLLCSIFEAVAIRLLLTLTATGVFLASLAGHLAQLNRSLELEQGIARADSGRIGSITQQKQAPLLFSPRRSETRANVPPDPRSGSCDIWWLL